MFHYRNKIQSMYHVPTTGPFSLCQWALTMGDSESCNIWYFTQTPERAIRWTSLLIFPKMALEKSLKYTTCMFLKVSKLSDEKKKNPYPKFEWFFFFNYQDHLKHMAIFFEHSVQTFCFIHGVSSANLTRHPYRTPPQNVGQFHSCHLSITLVIHSCPVLE